MWFAAVWVFVACRPAPGQIPHPYGFGSGTSGGTPGGTPVGVPGGTPGGTGGGTTDSGTTTTLCDTLPPPPATWTRLDNVHGTEEFTFDRWGNLINLDDAAGLLYSTAYLETPIVLAPYASSEVGAIRFRITGDTLVVADEGGGALMGLGLDGSTDVLLGSIIEPNSVAIHRDGHIYSTAADQLWKVDEDGVLAPSLQWTVADADLDGLVFDNAYERLFFNHDEDGMIGRSRVNVDGTLEEPVLIANVPVDFAELDGMAIDVCDNLYVVVTDGRIYRVDSTGAVSLYVTLSSPLGMWATAAHFGSGVGGWRSDALYVMNRYGNLFELDVGLAGKPDPHL